MTRALLALGLVAVVGVGGILLWRGSREGEVVAANPEFVQREPEHGSGGEVDEPRPRPMERESAARQAMETPEVQVAEARLEQVELSVRVRSKDTGLPITGLRLHLVPRDGAGWRSTNAEGHVGRPGESPSTDEEGLATFLVPLGRDFTLISWGEDAEPVQEEVPRFSSPGVEEIVVLLSTEPDLRFVGQVVAYGSLEPLPQARVVAVRHPSSWVTHEGQTKRLDEDGLEEWEVDSEGYFEIDTRSWDQASIEISAPSYGPVLVGRRPGHVARSTAFQVQLKPSGRVSVLATGEGGAALEDVTVIIETSIYHLTYSHSIAEVSFLGDVSWRSTTDSQGTCAIEGLPPKVPLKVRFRKKGGFTRRQPAPITLEAGEHREIVFRAGAGATVSGSLFDPERQPAAGVDVWLEPATPETNHYFRPYEKDVRTTRTDGSGQFSFEDVADGWWWIGPSPKSVYAPHAVPVQVSGGATDRELVLDVYRDLYITGKVLDPSEAPKAGVPVVAHDGKGAFLYDNTDQQGEFSLGPLSSGMFSLSARGREYAESETVDARAGDQGVVLRLRPGGALEGILMDSDTSLPLQGKVTVSNSGSVGLYAGMRMTWTQESGRFKFDGLEPGSYNVAGTTDEGKVAVQEYVVVSAGEASSDITLHAEPGAVVVVRYSGPNQYGQYRTKFGDVVVGGDGIEKGTSSRQVVPAGPVRVECFDGDPENPVVHELTLSPGEEKEVVFGEGE